MADYTHGWITKIIADGIQTSISLLITRYINIIKE